MRINEGPINVMPKPFDWMNVPPCAFVHEISPTAFSGRLFHILTATCVKLLPVDWVLDFCSSRAWPGVDRLE